MNAQINLFVPVDRRPGNPSQVFTCSRCGGRADLSHDAVWADLNGEPFVAYYCDDCHRTAQVWYEVRLDGENVWSESDDNGDMRPMRYRTEADAWAGIDEYFADCAKAYEQGYMSDDGSDTMLRVVRCHSDGTEECV